MQRTASLRSLGCAGRASKPEFVERLLAAERAYADPETRWLKTADELLAWILLVDRLVAGQIVP